MSERFAGFPKAAFAFFEELCDNNSREWFEANKQRYRDAVVAPMAVFIEAMQPRLAAISPHIVADPRPNGGSMFRIYRDVRFAKDKRPYKENAGCHFRHGRGKDAHAPGFYVHLEAGRVFFGGGLWKPPADHLQRIRQRIEKDPHAWKEAVGGKSFEQTFPDGVAGERLSRPPRGFDPDHPMIEDIKLKSFFAIRQSTPAVAQSAGFVDEVDAAFRAARPIMVFLCDAIDVPF